MTEEEKTTGEKTIEEMVVEEKTTGEKTIEEMVVEEKVVEEEINKEDIIDNYIEHIRNMSELTDEEIESVIDNAIEEDGELLDVLAKFLEKRQNIREKILCVEIGTREKEDVDKDKMREEIDDILESFDDPDYAYPLEDIIESLKDSGYTDPGTVIVDALGENMLCVDSIEEDETMYIALTKEGETLWGLRNR